MNVAYANAYRNYQQNQVQTASKEQLLLMLYDGAIKFLRLAQLKLEEKNLQEVNNNLLKCQDIITELASTLDMSYGEVSESLFALYEYMNYRLTQANIRKEKEPMEEVLKMLTELRETWNKAILQVRE